MSTDILISTIRDSDSGGTAKVYHLFTRSSGGSDR